MSDFYKLDSFEKMELHQDFKASSELEKTQSDTALGYLDMNSDYLRMRREQVWRADDRQSQRDWKEEKKARDRRKKALELAWHTNTRAKKRTLEARRASNNPKEKAYYANYSLRELEIFIKNSDRGGNSDSYNAVATELELYNHLTGRKNGGEHEGLESLIRLKKNCRDYISDHANPRSTKGKIRKSIISTISDKVELLVNEQTTKAFEESTRSINVWREDKTAENLNTAFRAAYVKMFHYLKGNIQLNAEQKSALDRDLKELLVSVREQPVDADQSNTMASRFFNALGWSGNQATLVDGDRLMDEVKKSRVNRIFHHTINSLNKNRDDVFPENGGEEEKQQWLQDKSAMPMVRQFVGADEEKRRQYYSTGVHGKGTYLDVAQYDINHILNGRAEEESKKDCWDYGQNPGSVQLDMVLNGNARIIKAPKLKRMIEGFAADFPEVYEYLVNSETIRHHDESQEYLTMFAAFFGFNVINGGAPDGNPFCNYQYFVASDRSALTISRDYTMRVNRRGLPSKNKYCNGRIQ